MFRFTSLINARAWFQLWAARRIGQPAGWVSSSSELAYGGQQARFNATFFAYFHAPDQRARIW